VRTFRHLSREEIAQVWSIDRTEVTDNVYHLENGSLVLRPERHDLRGWPPGEAEHYTPLLLDCFDRGGWCYGHFDGDGNSPIAAARSGKHFNRQLRTADER
jgi:predicted N-acetyltransferase YhbS